MKLNSCAIAGHRPTRFKWKYKESNAGCKRLKKRLYDQFALLYDQGVRRFYVGGTLGVDIWAGKILLQMSTLPEYSGIELIIVLPFEGHDKEWDCRSKKRLQFLVNHSAAYIVIGQSSQAPAVCYKLSNYYMVDHTDCLLAVFDNDYSIRSGIGVTVNYAKSKGKSIIFIHPDTAKVTKDSSFST